MQEYHYLKIDTAAGEIRLVHLIPGQQSDPIRLRIEHSVLTDPQKQPLVRPSKDELQSSLPGGWRIFETLEDRYIFFNKDTTTSTWKHPDTNYLDERYEQWSTIDLSFKPEYEALSYTWGSGSNPETVFAQDDRSQSSSGEESYSTLKATQNLIIALRHLRSTERIRTIWIDAICINQYDDHEKSQQITRMRDIYKFARRVIIWLGEEKNDSHLAIKTLKGLGMQLEISKERYALLPPDCTGDRNLLIASPVLEDKTWLTLFNLYGRSWFSRIWVMQEIAVANHDAIVQCGYDQIPWVVLRRALFRFPHGDVYPSAPEDLRRAFQARLQEIDYLARLTSEQEGISQLLGTSKSKAASNPRDKVYAVLGLVEPPAAPNIIPNYSLSVAEVYKNLFLKTIEPKNTVDLLSYCRIKSGILDAPSWVPNWNSPDQPVRIHFFARQMISTAFVHYKAPDILEILGKRCGILRAVSQPLPNDAKEFGRLIRFWGSPTSKLDNIASRGDPSIKAYMKSLTRGSFCERYTNFKGWPSVERLIQIYDENCDAELLENLRPYKPVGYTLLMTDNGQIGIGSVDAKSGDIVCCVPGCDVPLLFRSTLSPSPPSSTTTPISEAFQLVGDCYFDHLEDEQGIVCPLPPNIEVRVTIDADGAPIKIFRNSETGEESVDDPRVKSLRAEYERLQGGNDHAYSERNLDTESDNTLGCEILMACGVEFETFTLV